MFVKRKNRNNNNNKGSSKKNPSGNCICLQCNYSTPHLRGMPCFTALCPLCDVPLVKQKQSVDCNKQIGSKGNSNVSGCPQIDNELCSGCGACANECLNGAIIIEDSKAKIINEKCINCRACIDACPAEAII